MGDDEWWGNVQGLLCPTTTQLEGRRSAEWTFFSDSVLKFHQIPNYWTFWDSLFLLSIKHLVWRENVWIKSCIPDSKFFFILFLKFTGFVFPMQIDVLHENFWKQPKVSISKLLRNLEKYSDLLVCYRTADCFLFYTYLKKFIAICYTQTHTGHSHSKKLSLQWLSTVTSNARENRYKFYTRERQSRECTAKKYRGKIHLHTKQRAGILPPSDFHLISSRGASCGCWEGAPS